MEADGFIVVPLQSGEEVEVPRLELPDDVSDIITMLRREFVPIRLWIEFGVSARDWNGPVDVAGSGVFKCQAPPRDGVPPVCGSASMWASVCPVIAAFMYVLLVRSWRRLTTWGWAALGEQVEYFRQGKIDLAEKVFRDAVSDGTSRCMCRHRTSCARSFTL